MHTLVRYKICLWSLNMRDWCLYGHIWRYFRPRGVREGGIYIYYVRMMAIILMVYADSVWDKQMCMEINRDRTLRDFMFDCFEWRRMLKKRCVTIWLDSNILKKTKMYISILIDDINEARVFFWNILKTNKKFLVMDLHLHNESLMINENSHQNRLSHLALDLGDPFFNSRFAQIILVVIVQW